MSSSSSERPERYHYLVLKYLNGLPVVCTSTDRFDEAIRCLNFHNAVRVVRFGTDGTIYSYMRTKNPNSIVELRNTITAKDDDRVFSDALNWGKDDPVIFDSDNPKFLNTPYITKVFV